MTAGTWYVKNGRTAVNWGTDVPAGVAAVDIAKLVVGTVNEQWFLFARAGQAVTADAVTAAQAETTVGAVPAALTPSNGVAPGGTNTYAHLTDLAKYPDGSTRATSVPRARAKDPRDYGVVMNCATDSATLTANTAAFQAFITDIVTTGTEGVMPSGEIRINSTINFSYRPAWTLRGSGRSTTTIKQYANNVPILNLGSDTASFMHTFVLSSFGLTYNNSQPSTSTNAIAILVSQMPFNGRIENLYFLRGYYGMQVVSGIGCPWGTSWDDLMFTSGLTGGAMDWSLGVNAVPNNHWGRFTVSCDNMTQTAFKGIRGYNFRIDTIEFLSNNNGVRLMDFAAGTQADIGCLKLEVATYNAGVTLFNFTSANVANIQEIVVSGSSPHVFNVPSGQSLVILNTGTSAGGSARVTVGTVTASAFTTNTGAGGAYVFGTSPGAPIVAGRVQYVGPWLLTNTGGTTSADQLTIEEFMNSRISQDKGDTDYSPSLGDTCMLVFNTPLTAPRTITLPSNAGQLCNGAWFEFVFNGAINGTNTAVIKSGATTLATISTDKTVIRFTWRRNANGALGWVCTKYGALP